MNNPKFGYIKLGCGHVVDQDQEDEACQECAENAGMERPELTFDGCGINGPDEYRTRVCTFTEWGLIANKYGPMFAKAPETRAAAEAVAAGWREFRAQLEASGLADHALTSPDHPLSVADDAMITALAQWEEVTK